MEGFNPAAGEARKYGLQWWARAMFVFYASLGLAMGVFLIRQLQGSFSGNPTGIWLGLTASLMFSAYFGLSAFLYFVALDQDSVSLGGMFRTRTLRRDAVKGYRKISSRYGSYLVLEGKNPEDKNLRISNYFNTDDTWASWIQGLVDLDNQDREAILEAVANSQELGDSPEDRLLQLKKAKTAAIILTAAAIIAGGTVWLFRVAISLNVFCALDLVLILLPWVAVWFQWRSPLLFSLSGAKKDPRANLFLVLLAAGFGLLASPFQNLQTEQASSLLLYACLIGLSLTATFYLSTPSDSRRPSILWPLLIFTCMYGYGLALQANTQLDNSLPRSFTAQVLNKTYSSGRSTTYYLHLESWETTGSIKKVTVNSALYHSVSPGSTVCVTAHDGTLKVGWYTVDECK